MNGIPEVYLDMSMQQTWLKYEVIFLARNTERIVMTENGITISV